MPITPGENSADEAALLARRSDARGMVPALGMVVGMAMAAAWPVLGLWLVVGAVCALVALVFGGLRRSTPGTRRAVVCWGLLGWLALSGAWYVARDQRVVSDHITRYLDQEASLLRVRGVVEGPPRIASPIRGPFGAFSYRKPDTFFVLRVNSVWHAEPAGGGGWESASGRLLAKIEEADHRVRSGAGMEAVGWAASFGTPVNPGERDYTLAMRGRGLEGRLVMMASGNWHPLDDDARRARWWDRPIIGPLIGWWQGVRQGVADAAADALAIGLDHDTRRSELRGLLDRVLLGRWSEHLDELEDQFRRVGLAHLLAISGAHLGVLLGLVWLMVRTLGMRPNRAAVLVLIVLGMYLMMIPVKVPVARASVMAAMLLGGFATGRGGGPQQRLGLAAIIVLLWRPGDLFDPGFQLSFITVWALIRYTGTVSRWLVPEPMLIEQRPAWFDAMRWLADASAVSIVAFAAATPVVAYHFQLFSTLSILLSLAALPVFVGLLAVGYTKVLVGMLLPSVSLLLAEPTAALGGALAWLVRRVDAVPMSSLDLAVRPSVVWVLGVLVCVAAVIEGHFARRRGAMIATGCVLLGWVLVQQDPGLVDAALGRDRPAIRMDSFSVGDGSCHLIRAGGHTLMFDCGSRTYPLVGRNSIVPGLRALGVARIDTLIISHGDLDHFAGVLDVARHIDIRRVLMPPQMLTEAQQPDDPEHDHTRATTHLINELARLGISTELIWRGWTMQHGGVRFEAHWPAPDFSHPRNNESSVVLMVSADQARLLMTGDLEATGMRHLLDSGDDLRATVMEVPHHGSFVDLSPAFTEAVSPRLLIQSSGPRWQMRDRWPQVIQQQGLDRLVTHEVGMITVKLWRDGRMQTRTFLEDD